MNPTMDTMEQACYIWWRLHEAEETEDLEEYLAKILGEINHISAHDSVVDSIFGSDSDSDSDSESDLAESDSDSDSWSGGPDYGAPRYAGYVSCGEGVYVRSRSVIAIE